MESRREAGAPLVPISARESVVVEVAQSGFTADDPIFSPSWRLIDLTRDEHHPRHRRPVLRWIGHALGLAYVLVTLLFGPIRWLARWLERQQIVRRYERRVAALPAAAGLALALLALSLLELSKIAVLLSYRFAGLPGAVAAMLCAKASIGYFAHVTWRAARSKVVAAYPWAARVDAWIGAQLARLRGFRDRWLGYLRARSWYGGAVAALGEFRRRAARWAGAIRGRLTPFSASATDSRQRLDR